MLFNRVLQRLPKPKSGTRSHHPNPFDPQTTRGWKAAVKVSDVCVCICQRTNMAIEYHDIIHHHPYAIVEDNMKLI